MFYYIFSNSFLPRKVLTIVINEFIKFHFIMIQKKYLIREVITTKFLIFNNLLISTKYIFFNILIYNIYSINYTNYIPYFHNK
jgi:hypothetical protein